MLILGRETDACPAADIANAHAELGSAKVPPRHSAT